MEGTGTELGPYVIERRLAAGGMAEVFVADRRGAHGFSKRVALKRILPQFSKDRAFVRMFIDEAQLVAKLTHPNIVQVFDFGDMDGQLFIAMELVQGANVNRLLRAVAAEGEAVPLEVALHVASQTAHALAYAHGARDDQGQPIGIVHRDVSPANILLTYTGHVKLSDFGIARAFGKETFTDRGHVRGKLGYMSPEQVMAESLSGRSDVFTLCTVLAEMLLAKPLFGTGSNMDVLLRIRDVDLRPLDDAPVPIDADVQQVLRLGLRPSPDERPSASKLARALDELMRQRGFARGPHRLSQLLFRLGLLGDESLQGFDPNSATQPNSVPLRMPEGTSPQKLGVGQRGGEPPPARTEYKMLSESGQLEGPITYLSIIDRIMSGKVSSSTLVCKKDGNFVPANALAEFRRFLNSAALRWDKDPPESDATHTGEFPTAPILHVIHEVSTRFGTGVLSLRNGERRKRIYFVEGRPEFVCSTDKSELLGEFLVENGQCKREDIESALAILSRFEGRIGDALVSLGVLRPMDLFRAIQSHLRQRYLEAFQWSEGSWMFVPRVTSGEEMVTFGDSTPELLRDGVKCMAPEAVVAALAPVWETPIQRHPAPPVAMAQYRLDPTWSAWLNDESELSPRERVSKVCADSPESSRAAIELDLKRALCLGTGCDLLHVSV